MAGTPMVYVICDQNCKYEGMTKEQILTAIMQAVEGGEIKDVDAGFVTTIKTINGLPLKFFVGEQDVYDALTEEQKNNLFAIITNDTTKEGLLAAIAELQTRHAELEELFNKLTNLGSPARVSMVYDSLGKIVDASCTTEELMLLLPANSNVAFTVNTNDIAVNLTDLPFKNTAENSYGFVTLYKGWTNNYCYGIAWDIYGGIYHYKYHTGTATDKNGWHKIYTAAEGSTIQDVSYATEEDRPTFDLDFGSTYLITATIDESFHQDSGTITGDIQGDIISLNFMLSIPKEEDLTIKYSLPYPDFVGAVLANIYSSLAHASTSLNNNCDYYLRVNLTKPADSTPQAVIDLMRRTPSNTAFEIYTSSANALEPVKFECFKII